MNPGDVVDVAQGFGNLGGSLVLISMAAWFVYRKGHGWFRSNDSKLDMLKDGQEATNNHLERLNGRVAKHDEAILALKEISANHDGKIEALLIALTKKES